MVDKVFLKRIFRRIARNWKRLACVSLLVVVTTALFVGYFVGTSSVVDSIKFFNDNNRLEKGFFYSFEDIQNQNTEKMIYADITSKDKTLRVFKFREKINKYQVTTGVDISKRNEILLDENYMKAQRYVIGDELLLEGNVFVIVGTAISPDYIMTKKSELILQPNADTFGIGFVSSDSFQEYFIGISNAYYSYSEDYELSTIAKNFPNIVYAKDTENNSRTKQVMGDATSPQQLSILIVSIFFLITVILLAIYFFEEKNREEKNIQTFSFLGYSSKQIINHYSTEIFVTLNIFCLIGSIVGILVIPIIMDMNGSIYNYPIMQVSMSKLIISLFLSFFLINMVCFILSRIILKDKNSSFRSKGRRTLYSLPKLLNFSTKYRLVKILRNKKEIVLFTLLILVTGILINFSFLLKISVEKYVEKLDTETKYEYMYQVDSTKKMNTVHSSEEIVNIVNLYDSDNIVQNVYLVENASKYFDIKDDTVVITQAYADKYKTSIGDYLYLSDPINDTEHKFRVDKISANETVSEIYLNLETYEYLTKDVYSIQNIISENFYEEEWYTSFISRDEIISSGKSILNIINKQISMILVIAVVIEFALVFSLIRFIYENSQGSIKILKLLGNENKELMKIHFGFNSILAFVIISISYLLSVVLVRVFLDNIMFTFVNYVPVQATITTFLIGNILILGVYFMFVMNFKKKIKK